MREAKVHYTFTCDACGKVFTPPSGKAVYPKIRIIMAFDEENDDGDEERIEDGDFCQDCKDKIMVLLNNISLANPMPLPQEESK